VHEQDRQTTVLFKFSATKAYHDILLLFTRFKC